MNLLVRSCSLVLPMVLLLTGCSGQRTVPPEPSSPAEPGLLFRCLGYADVEGGAVSLRPDRTGRVVAVLVGEGDRVGPGQELLRLDETDARLEEERAGAALRAAEARAAQQRQEAEQQPARLRQLEATLEATSSRLAGARVSLRRQENLLEQRLVSKEEVQVARSFVQELVASEEAARARLAEARAIDPKLAVRAAEAEVEAARARVGQARHARTQTILRAPQAGFILTLDARVGEIAGQPGSSPPVLFLPDRPWIVRAEVDQEHAAQVKVGLPVRVRDEYTETGPWKGTVTRIGTIYGRRKHRDDPTRLTDVPTLECVLKLESGAGPLQVGQKLRVSFYENGDVGGP